MDTFLFVLELALKYLGFATILFTAVMLYVVKTETPGKHKMPHPRNAVTEREYQHIISIHPSQR